MADRQARLITKRTSVPGKIPTGTTGNELNYIKSGELASNLADHSLWGYDGTDVFEYGSNSFLGLTGGTISGDLFVSGNLSASTLFSGSTELTEIIDNQIELGLSALTSSYFDAYDGTGGTISITTSWSAKVPLNAQREIGDDFTHSVSVNNDEVTINTAAKYLVMGRVSADVGIGTSRSQAECRLEVSTDGGTVWNPVPGTNGELYLRLTNYGATASFQAILNPSVGDKYRITFRRALGSDQVRLTPDGSSLTIAKVVGGQKGDKGLPGDLYLNGFSDFYVSGTTYSDVYSGNTQEAVYYGDGSNLTGIEHTAVQPGINIFTGGTANAPTVNLVASPSINNLVLSGTATIPNSGLIIRNPANTFSNIIASSAIVANRVFTLPLIAANDTFVTADFVQTLTNKTLTSPVINTQVSGTITSGGNITATNFLIGATATQTLTNKTISSTDNTITSTSQAVGDILKNNGSKYVRLARGSANQVLTVNSAGTDISWASPSTPIFGQGFSFQENTTSVNSNSTAGYATNNLTVVGHSYTVNAPVDGTYKFGVKYNYTTTSALQSSKFRWYLDGVAQARITEIELKDTTDDVTWANFFYATLTAGNHTLQIRIASENAGMTITLSSSAVEFWRVT